MPPTAGGTRKDNVGNTMTETTEMTMANEIRGLRRPFRNRTTLFSQIRNPKSEIRNKDQNPKHRNVQNPPGMATGFGHSPLRSFGFALKMGRKPLETKPWDLTADDTDGRRFSFNGDADASAWAIVSDFFSRLGPIAVKLGLLLSVAALVCGALPSVAAESPPPKAKPSNRKPALAVYPAPDEFTRARAELERVNFAALRRAVRDLTASFPARYTQGEEYLRRADAYEQRTSQVLEALAKSDPTALREAEAIVAFQREALLANPLLDFDRLLLIKRKPIGDPRRGEDYDRGLGKFIGLPQQSSWQLHTMPNVTGWDNEIAVLSPVRPDGKLTTLFRPPATELISEIDLHFDADRLLFSMPDSNRLWQIFELRADGSGLRQIHAIDHRDAHNLDACYLPDGNIVFVSTAPFQGVPCNAGVEVGLAYRMDGNGQHIRQLCFDQAHSYCPTVMNDGRVLFLRWEYTDIPHVWARFLFTMDPDGMNQREFYGSGSYWPNSIFYARPIPNHPSKVVGIVTGHHVGRVGELVIFEPAQGRYSGDGVVQRIPGYGQKLAPRIEDKLTVGSFPKFVHPWPLSDKYFLVTAKPATNDLWGIYLVDVFDNFVLLKELEGCALLEPIPFRPRPAPPVIPDKIDPARKDALVYLENIYEGPGLQGVPRGAVKKLRVFSYHYGYQKIAGINHRVGADGPWEPKRVLGTVPVEPDGSALFRVPANTPIALHPLDAEGKAIQMFRSWFTAMPGEFVSCTGCHEKQNSGPQNGRQVLALHKAPVDIEPWHGPVRGFSFAREVQPVLDQYCVSCHDGKPRSDGTTPADLRGDQGRFICYKNSEPEPVIVGGVPREKLVAQYGGVFEPGYIELRRYIRVGGLESDLRLLAPGEFHADTTELVQLLQKGHYGVQLDAEAWDRLTTWIDLNAPAHGTWHEVVGWGKITNNHAWRRDLVKRYGGIDEDPEVIPEIPRPVFKQVAATTPKPAEAGTPNLPGWPFDAAEAQRRQSAAGATSRTVDLGSGIRLQLALIPAGEFVMGDPNGCEDERPPARVKIARPFWMGKCEVNNEQFAQFDPSHDSRFEDMSSWIFNEEGLGWKLNHPRQPVVRVSWREAMGFCAWLTAKLGEKVSLPTEAQWEYACRAGTATPFFYGDANADFSRFANLADANIRRMVYDARDQYSPDLVPRDARFNDGALVTTDVGSYAPNPWGLHDMHGNAWEWTRSTYQPYPYRDDDGRNEVADAGRKVARGGSWYDRPKRCRSAFRLSYPAWQKVYNVGFRVVIETDGKTELAARVK